MTTTVRDVDGWLQGAACAGKASERWLKAKPSEAVEICRGCPVRIECLHDALARKTSGIWGGLTLAERRALPVLPSGKAEALEVLRNLLGSAGTVKNTAAEERQPTRKAPRPATTPPRKQKEKKASSPTKAKATSQPKDPASLARDDVAELLRAGASHAQITEQLRVSARVVTATRKAYGIPYPRKSGYRYTPEERAENERRTLELLRAGATHAEVTRQVGISAPTTVRIRKQAGLPASKNHGGPPARTKAEALAATVEPYGDGHARWTGPMSGRMPTLFANRGRYNARHVVFEQHHGRPPVGYVRTSCEEAGCIAGAHLVDDTTRDTPAEEPVTVQALQDLLTEIDHQGGPQAARDNRLNLSEPEPTMPNPDTTSHPSYIAKAAADSLPFPSLLKWGDAHPDPEVQAQAAQARVAVHGLRARHAADHELTALTDEAEQLEKKLAEIRARQAEIKPKKKGTRKPSSYVRDYEPRTVRAWAAEAGVDCPGVGQIPKRVLEAWRAANTTASTDA